VISGANGYTWLDSCQWKGILTESASRTKNLDDGQFLVHGALPAHKQEARPI